MNGGGENKEEGIEKEREEGGERGMRKSECRIRKDRRQEREDWKKKYGRIKNTE